MTTISRGDPILIKLPCLPCSVNRAWRTFRGRWVLSTEYTRLKRLVRAAVNGRRLDSRFCTVKLYLFPPNHREFDVDNRSKCLFDALTESGFWEDDRIVTGLSVEKCFPVVGGACSILVTPSDTPYLDEESLPSSVTNDLTPYRTKAELKQLERLRKKNGTSILPKGGD